VGLWLNAVMPVLCDKRSNPWVVVAKEYGIFGTAHDQTVELDKLFAADFAAAVAKIGE
jgi:hypothetical protein